MSTGWRYRVASVVGTGLLVALAIAVVNEPVIQDAFAAVPYFGGPAPEVLSDSELLWAIFTTVFIFLAAMWPLFKPRPRRILNTILETQRRILLAMVGLAALGYFNYSYRLPRSTVMLGTALLLVVLPMYMVVIRRQPQSGRRALLVGDDPDAMRRMLNTAELNVLGYAGPTGITNSSLGRPGEVIDIERLGGLSRIEDVIVSNDIDTVLLGFGSTDRAEFFGTLATCHEHGIHAKLHRSHADTVLTAPTPGSELVDIDLEPWDPQDRIIKRLFDLGFAVTALLFLTPVIVAIAIAIKLDDGGPILYGQERTAEFGETFRVYKFRSMIQHAEAETGAKVSEEDNGGVDPRVTRIGQVLRKTHLDEIPQLWSILVGNMSVVGPRPERPELDDDIQRVVGEWRRRWFVKPGLTGLAQIRGATGHDPGTKLRHDIEYIKRQSFWVDVTIVIRQLWQVGSDAIGFILSDSDIESDSPPAKARETDPGKKGAGKSSVREDGGRVGQEDGQTDEGGRGMEADGHQMGQYNFESESVETDDTGDASRQA